MSTIHQNSHGCHNESLQLLHARDLAEWEAAHHLASFEQHTIAAGCHLDKYDACLARIKVIDAALAAEEVPA